MIITHIIGGLGNQMFQYAIGKSLSVKHNSELKLDTEDFEKYKLHSYGLDKLNISSSNAKSVELQKYKSFSFLQKVLNKISGNKNIYQERYFHYDSNYEGLQDNIYIKGYWQSEKYFLDIRDILLTEFKPKVENIDENLKDEVKATNSISLHIRRGDYLSDKNANATHGIVGLEYYKKAIEFLNTKIEKPSYYIFSDDIDWVKENLIFDNKKTFVEGNTNYEDMYLMSLCKHNIIANSTFSWWSGWLNENKNKIVVAPKEWFQTDEFNTKDLYPKDWIQL